VPFSDGAESSVKYHSVTIYFLTSTAKTARNSVWRAVLVGRYPHLNQNNRTGWEEPWRPQKFNPLQNKQKRGTVVSNYYEQSW